MTNLTSQPFPNGENKYGLIYADPPWQFKNKSSRGSAQSHYPTMSVEELCKLPVSRIAATDCLLAMWWVPSQPDAALAVLKAWGFRLATMKGFTWVKQNKNGKPFLGLGNYTRGNTEDCLFAVRGKTGNLIKNHGISQLVEAPRMEHSRKPSKAHALLVSLTEQERRIELFARCSHQGWDQWGNETFKFNSNVTEKVT